MPLNNSSTNKARSENIATEIRAGKDPKQAEAIAYAEQRRARDCLNAERAALDAERMNYELQRITTFPGTTLERMSTK
jgi:hypothetical protein